MDLQGRTPRFHHLIASEKPGETDASARLDRYVSQHGHIRSDGLRKNKMAGAMTVVNHQIVSAERHAVEKCSIRAVCELRQFLVKDSAMSGCFHAVQLFNQLADFAVRNRIVPVPLLQRRFSLWGARVQKTHHVDRFNRISEDSRNWPVPRVLQQLHAIQQ